MKFYIAKIHLKGLGFKAYLSKSKKKLCIYQGSNIYQRFEIPPKVRVLCLKKKIYIVSYNKRAYKQFVWLIKFYKLPGRYKPKGLDDSKKPNPPLPYKPGKKPR